MHRRFFVVCFWFVERQHVLARLTLDENRRVEAERLGHVLHLRQIGEIVQPEPDQELLGRRVEERAADDTADRVMRMPFPEKDGQAVLNT